MPRCPRVVIRAPTPSPAAPTRTARRLASSEAISLCRKPAEFFEFLATAQYTLCEVHAKTALLTRWMMTSVGDPPYPPFKSRPLVKEADIRPSPKESELRR